MKILQLLPENKRPNIYHGIERIMERYERGETGTSVMLPPRYGKSDIIRGSILEFNQLGITTCVMVGPWTLLADQIKDATRIEDMYRRFGVDLKTSFVGHRSQKLTKADWWKRHTGNYNLVSMTLALAHCNIIAFIDGLEQMAQTFGRPVPLFIDECQLTKKFQAWGELINKALPHSYIIPLTGTPVPAMPGFEDVYADWENVQRVMHRKRIVEGEIKQFREIYEGRSRDLQEINADVEVSWKTAWEEGALAPANVVWVDTEVYENDELLGNLSELKKEDLAGRLRSIIEKQDMVEEMSRVGIKRLLCYRPSTQMLVVTGFDRVEGNYNEHAQRFREAIEEELRLVGSDNDFRIEIATSATNEGEPDEKATEKIKQFQDGLIQILIVKAMGVVGLDVPNCKVEIWASSIRQGPMFAQGLARVLTINGDAASVILPKDIDAQNGWTRLVKDQGGEAKETDLFKVEEEEEPVNWDTPPPINIDHTHIDGYSDQFGKLESGDHEELLATIKRKYKTGNLTDFEILENNKMGGFVVTEEDKQNFRNVNSEKAKSGVRDADEDYTKLQGRFGQKVKAILRNRGFFSWKDKELWLLKNKELVKAAKDYVGFRGWVPDVDDAELLKKLIEALDYVADSVFK